MPRRALTTFLLALEFLTIVRLRRPAEADPRDLGASLVWFPLVGLLIGLTMAGTDWLLHRLAFDDYYPDPVALTLVILTEIVLTGAIHVDGLADTADGLFGGRTPERRLEIMRDSRIGTFGVVAIVFFVLLIYLSLASTEREYRHPALIVVPAISRYAMVLALVLFPYARPSGLGKVFHDNVSPLALVGSTVIAAVAVFVVGVWFLDTDVGVVYLALIPGAMLVTAAIGFFVSRRLGGLTGDVYGAIGVLVELLLFLTLRGDAYATLRSGLLIF